MPNLTSSVSRELGSIVQRFAQASTMARAVASLSFALDHAVRHGLRRIVSIIPFSSIIERAAEVCRKVLDTCEDVLEYNASFDWDGAAGRAFEDRCSVGRDL